jgi:hypothetical protein
MGEKWYTVERGCGFTQPLRYLKEDAPEDRDLALVTQPVPEAKEQPGLEPEKRR